ncbi:MAG: hypothetical protein Ct9H300mP14_05030 [Gammaproteobacteria bacterium]|nr:MAG: hypothetical protein Ct9H300mP14_05030 [Gammaproteobacteria bacterium]
MEGSTEESSSPPPKSLLRAGQKTAKTLNGSISKTGDGVTCHRFFFQNWLESVNSLSIGMLNHYHLPLRIEANFLFKGQLGTTDE